MEEVAWGPVEWEIVSGEGDGELWSNRSEICIGRDGGDVNPRGGSWVRGRPWWPLGT